MDCYDKNCMSGSGANREVEIKLRVADAASGRKLLRNAGFRVVRRRHFESNIVFDQPGGQLRKRGMLLRLRRAGRHATLTFKGESVPGKHKTREEIEFGIAEPESLIMILRRIGFQEAFRYEKCRTLYQLGGAGGVATLDETPIGVYIELEGFPGWIDNIARRLKFSENHYITKSYGQLYLENCRRNGLVPRDMVFESPPCGGVARKSP